MSPEQTIEELMQEVERTQPSLKHDETYRELLDFVLQFPREHDTELYDLRREQLHSYVAHALADQKIEPLWQELPPALQYPTGIHLGTSFGRQVYLRPMDLTRNLELAGTTGSGKTNTLLYLFRQLPSFGIRSWIIDLMREYHVLADYGYTVITTDELRLNPLNMVHTGDARRNMQVFARIFAHSQGLLYGSRNYLRERLGELYTWCKQYNQWPTLEDLRVFIAHYPEKGPDYKGYRDRTLVRLNAMLQQDSHILDVQQGMSIEELVQRDIVFDLRDLADETQVLLAECIMAMLYEYYLASGIQHRLRHVLGMDEARHLWNRHREQLAQQEQPYNIDFLAETRKYGIGAVLAGQEPTQLSQSASALTHMKGMMQLSAPKDITHMAEAMKLDDRQRHAAQQLHRGEMIFKLSESLPSKVTVPRFVT